MQCASFSMLDGPGGCPWHRKASAKTSSKLNKFLHSEVNQIIQHIIVQDQDGQNNKKLIRLNHNKPPYFRVYTIIITFHDIFLSKLINEIKIYMRENIQHSDP